MIYLFNIIKSNFFHTLKAFLASHNLTYLLLLVSINLCLISCDIKNQTNDNANKNQNKEQPQNNVKTAIDSLETNLVIIGGGKNRITAENIKNQYITDQKFNSAINGIPTIILSDTISGLNLGFYIVSIGCETNDDEVKSIIQQANTYWKGVYYRKIKLDANQYKTIASKIVVKPKCVFKHLSKAYDFEIEVDILSDSTIIKVTPISNERLNTIYVNTNLFLSTFSTCNDYTVSSYSTNINTEPIDAGDYGDFVIADFNFDSQDDYAVKTTSGGSVGFPHYNFYIQTDGRFIKDDYLSSIGIFPKEIDKSRKQLVISYLQDRCTMINSSYQLDYETNTWHKLSEEKTTLCE